MSLLDLGFDALDDIAGVQRAVHHHNRGDNIAFAVAARLAQPGNIANVDPRDVLQLHGHAIGLR